MSFSDSVVYKNLIWRYAERFLAQLVTFIVTLVLARLLSPSDYGVVALITVIISMLEVFSTRGYNQALIQRDDINDTDYSTIFLVNMLMNIILCIVVFFVSPFVADFYSNPNIILMLRILSLKLIISGFNSIQQAYVQRNMLFRKFFYSTLFGTIVSGLVGIIVALLGGGPWAIIVQSITNSCVDMIVLFFTIEWKPSLQFSWKSFSKMSGYGLKMFMMGILDSIYDNLRALIIGRKYTSEDLAYYNQGQKLPNMIICNTQIAASNVFFSALSREKEHMKEKMREYISMMFFFLCPVMVGLACTSNDVITILFSNKWLASSEYMIIYCFSYLCWIPQIPIIQALNASNRTGKTLILSIFHRGAGITLLIVCLNKGPLFIAIGALAADILITVAVYIFGIIWMKYSLVEIIKDIYKTVISAAIMSFIVLELHILINGVFVRFVLEIVVGVLTYGITSKLLKNDNIKYFSKIKGVIRGKKAENQR